MQVILLEDLEGLGARGATVNVKPGHARNYLLPRKLAIPATSKAGNLYQELSRQKEAQREKLLTQARAEAAKLEGLEINIPSGERGRHLVRLGDQDRRGGGLAAGHSIEAPDRDAGETIKQPGVTRCRCASCPGRRHGRVWWCARDP
jgi:large subunit ribosomal protein L9